MDASDLSICLGCSLDRATIWLPEIHEAMGRGDILTPARKAAFLAQIGHESASLARIEENLNYSADGLIRVFSRYFTEDQALRYARRPEAIASRVYADRMGNGPEHTGEGWKYRGRGLIQITGKDSYRNCGVWLGIDLVAEPDLVIRRTIAALSASWFWIVRKLNDYADRGDFIGMTRAINGGTHGLEDRETRWNRAKAVLMVA